MSEQMKAATIRALYGALFVAALDFFLGLQIAPVLNSDTIARAGLGFAVSFLAYMVARGVAEGFIDSNRATKGQVYPSDVTASKPIEPVVVVRDAEVVKE
jgi:hypothetical protein